MPRRIARRATRARESDACTDAAGALVANIACVCVRWRVRAERACGVAQATTEVCAFAEARSVTFHPRTERLAPRRDAHTSVRESRMHRRNDEESQSVNFVESFSVTGCAVLCIFRDFLGGCMASAIKGPSIGIAPPLFDAPGE